MPSTVSPRRLWIFNLFVVSLFLIIIYQLTQLMIVRRPALLELADKQHRLKIEVPPVRGLIVDRMGKELATNLMAPSIYAVPRMIAKEDVPALSKKIADILKLSQTRVSDRISRDKSFVWLKRKVSPEEASAIDKLGVSSLGTIKEYKRFYPQGDLLAQILGFTGIDNSGLEGIELNWNRELQGRSGWRYTKRDALGRELKAFEVKHIPAVDGHKVTLTIDQYLQYLTERALDRAYTQYKAKGATAIIMEVKTGRILAMANRPSFDPNHYGKATSDAHRNRAVTDMYEPGSVFKIVAASAALNENKVTPETTFNCENGAWDYGPKVLHDVHSYGTLTFEEVIIKSSNIGSVKISQRMEPAVYESYVERFGFGKATGIDLPGEAPGFVRPYTQWSKTSPYNVPIGQEIMVTALQMTVAMDVIANGGNLVKPFILEKIEDSAGVVIKENKPFIRAQVIRPEVAETMRHILMRVVEEGTGKSAKMNGISAGGKTGTAQKVLPNGRGYSHSAFMSSFIGFAPVEDPKFVMTVVVDEPRPVYYGGVVAAPVFKEVMETALLSMGHIPDNAKTLDQINESFKKKQSAPENLPKPKRVSNAGSRIATR